MTAMIVISIITALAAPTPNCPRLKENWYMKTAGTSDAVPGPPPVNAMTRSKLLIAMWERMSVTEKKTGRKPGMMMRR